MWYILKGCSLYREFFEIFFFSLNATTFACVEHASPSGEASDGGNELEVEFEPDTGILTRRDLDRHDTDGTKVIRNQVLHLDRNAIFKNIHTGSAKNFLDISRKGFAENIDAETGDESNAAYLERESGVFAFEFLEIDSKVRNQWDIVPDWEAEPVGVKFQLLYDYRRLSKYW